ncbi:MAG: flagellar M-ring protein FliF, partial [Betaproteobacteria bacterium]|nr:flagellar M-ring protein FliF [Betaproteobacteria bacterium]
MVIDYKEYVEKAKGLWGKYSFNQRLIIAGVAVVTLAVFLAVVLWINKPEYKVLFTNLTPEDASRVVTMLQGEKIPYSLENSG